MNRHCSQCGSERIVEDARLVDETDNSRGPGRMVVYADPGALIFKEAEYVEVIGDICCDCGSLVWRCQGDLDRLWEAYLRANRVR